MLHFITEISDSFSIRKSHDLDVDIPGITIPSHKSALHTAVTVPVLVFGQGQYGIVN